MSGKSDHFISDMLAKNQTTRDQLLKGTFLTLFEIATYREVFVADMLVSHTLEGGGPVELGCTVSTWF